MIFPHSCLLYPIHAGRFFHKIKSEIEVLLIFFKWNDQQWKKSKSPCTTFNFNESKEGAPSAPIEGTLLLFKQVEWRGWRWVKVNAYTKADWDDGKEMKQEFALPETFLCARTPRVIQQCALIHKLVVICLRTKVA